MTPAATAPPSTPLGGAVAGAGTCDEQSLPVQPASHKHVPVPLGIPEPSHEPWEQMGQAAHDAPQKPGAQPLRSQSPGKGQ